MRNKKFFNFDLVSLLTSVGRDMEIDHDTLSYCIQRTKSEGLKFLTVTLPTLQAALLRSLEVGYFDRTGLTAFRWKGRALAHFGELTSLIFNSDGVLRSDACPLAIYRLRQFTGYFYKLVLDEELGSEALIQDFVTLDEKIDSAGYDIAFADEIRKYIETRYKFPRFEEVLDLHRPRTGPGTYSQARPDSMIPPHVWKQTSDMLRLPPEYHGISGFFKSYPSSPERLTTGVDTNEVSQLLFVPKDSRGPRTIVREPLKRLMVQMSFFDWFSSYLEEETRGRVMFSDQSQNNKLAQIGSVDGRFATLDLKDASDSVSFKLCKQLSSNIPVLRKFLSFRSTHVDLGGGRLHRLNKLAGMGSGLTFAWMAFIIHSAITVEATKCFGGTSYNHAKNVYVYGDDIIVPASYVPVALRALRKVGLNVNDKKSFTRLRLGQHGYFRESCGGDYFSGSNVSTLKLRLANSGVKAVRNAGSNPFLSVTRRAQGLVQVIDHAKELVINGMIETAEYFYSVAEGQLGKLTEYSNPECAALGRYVTKFIRFEYDATGMYPKVRVPIAAPLKEEWGPIVSPWFYMKPILGRKASPCVFDPVVTKDPYGTLAIPRQTVIKRRYVSTLSLVR